MSEWIEWKWTEEKPYPETLETEIQVKWNDGDDDDMTWKVVQWENEFKQDTMQRIWITHYRLA